MTRASFVMLLLFAATPVLGAQDESRVALAPAAPFGPHYAIIEPVEATMIEDARIAGTIRIELALEMADASAAAHLADHQPLLRDAALSALSDFGGWQASGQMPVDCRRLAADLTRAIKPHAKGLVAVRLLRVEAR